MMIRRGIMLAALSFAFVLPGSAETVRTLLTKENRFPELHRAEIGALVEYIDFTDDGENVLLAGANQTVGTAFARYMATENLALQASLPYGKLDTDFAGSESGLGDFAVGLELRAFEHFFRFPYVIPHAEVRFDTGEEKAALGDNQSSTLLGVTLGSKVYDEPIHVNFDFAYEIIDDADNIFTLAASVIWDLTDRFALLVEAQLSDEESPLGQVDHPTRFIGGMAYKATEECTVSAYGGGANAAPEDVIAAVRIAWEM